MAEGVLSPVLFPWFPSKLLTPCWYQDVQMPFFLPWICQVRLLALQCWYVYELQISPEFYGLHGIVVLNPVNHTSPHLVFLLPRVFRNSGNQKWLLSRIWKDSDRIAQSLNPMEMVPNLTKQACEEQGVWGISCPDSKKIWQVPASVLSFLQHRQAENIKLLH